MEMVMHLLREFDKVPARISFPRRYSGFDRRARGEQYTAGRRIAVSHMSGSLRRPLHERVRRVSRRVCRRNVYTRTFKASALT